MANDRETQEKPREEALQEQVLELQQEVNRLEKDLRTYRKTGQQRHLEINRLRKSLTLLKNSVSDQLHKEYIGLVLSKDSSDQECGE